MRIFLSQSQVAQPCCMRPCSNNCLQLPSSHNPPFLRKHGGHFSVQAGSDHAARRHWPTHHALKKGIVTRTTVRTSMHARCIGALEWLSSTSKQGFCRPRPCCPPQNKYHPNNNNNHKCYLH
eukprot:364059-Chlamydomonas_euryale.AAC.5